MKYRIDRSCCKPHIKSYVVLYKRPLFYSWGLLMQDWYYDKASIIFHPRQECEDYLKDNIMSKIEDLVLSVDQMNHLKELGLNIDESSHWWVSRSKDSKGNPIKVRKWFITLSNVKPRCSFIEWDIVPTLTLQEILEILPREIEFNTLYGGKECATLNINWDNIKPCIWYEANEVNLSLYVNDSLLEASYEMLCWLLENGYLKV